VAPFAGDEIGAGPRPAVEGDPRAAAGAEDGREDDAPARAGAIDGLGQGEAVGVVLAADFATERATEIAIQRLAVERDGVGVLDEAVPGRNRAGNADAHGAALAQGGFRLVHQSGEGRHDGVVARGRRVRPLAIELLAAVAERDDFRLGAAEIDADAHGPASR